MKKMEPLDENKEYDVSDFVVAEIVNSLLTSGKDKTNRICIMKKDKDSKIFYDIVSGMPFIPYELLFKDNYIYTVGARLPLEYYFPDKEKITGSELYSFNLEVLYEGFSAPQKSEHVKKYIYDIKDFF